MSNIHTPERLIDQNETQKQYRARQSASKRLAKMVNKLDGLVKLEVGIVNNPRQYSTKFGRTNRYA